MKKIYTVLIIVFGTLSMIQAQNDFITSWEIPAGQTDLTFAVYFTPGEQVDYYWETVPSGQSGTGSLSNQGFNTITGLPDNTTIELHLSDEHLNAFRLHESPTNSGGPDRFLINDVIQWGDVQWTAMTGMFNGAFNLNVTASDIPNLSLIDAVGNAGLSYMFQQCNNLNGPQNINDWDVSTVKNLSNMFSNAQAFNQNIGDWDVSNVTFFQNMFQAAFMFNQDISNWNVSNATNLTAMFSQASDFNQDISNWDVSNVTIMRNMFNYATNFNQDISNWDVSNVIDMYYMFNYATHFNQNISNWNVSNVTTMQGMFRHALNFNQYLGNWSLENLTNANAMLMFAGLDCGNYSSSLIAWAANSNTANDVDFGNQYMEYGTNAVAARDQLISVNNWTINGDLANGNECIACINTSSNISENTCDVYIAPDGIEYTSSGNYTAVIPNAAGCDSTISITLTVINVDTGVTNNDPELVAQAVGASYQWYECTGGTPTNLINGATNASFSPTSNGSYALEVTQMGCSAFSACESIGSLNLQELDNYFFNIYPNPTSDQLTIELSQPTDIYIMDALGNIVYSANSMVSQTIDVAHFAQGVYFVKVGNTTQRFVKQ